MMCSYLNKRVGPSCDSLSSRLINKSLKAKAVNIKAEKEKITSRTGAKNSQTNFTIEKKLKT